VWLCQDNSSRSLTSCQDKLHHAIWGSVPGLAGKKLLLLVAAGT